MMVQMEAAVEKGRVFPVDVGLMFRKAAVYSAVIITVLLVVKVGILAYTVERVRAFMLEWLTDPVKAVKVVGACLLVFATLFAFCYLLCGISALVWEVRIVGSRIYGRNEYGLKRSFEIGEITEKEYMTMSGFGGWNLRAGKSGSILVLDATKDLKGLFEMVGPVPGE